MNLLRHAVSKRKRRFVDKETGLDLDLTYITPSLIAMGFPSRSIEAMYRNPISDVEKFLDSRHEGAYKVYNLCSERSYPEQRFHGRVARFPFHDHSPPPFQLIHPFCEDVSDWLHSAAGNVVAVHCKAGKGRTGVMICSFLVHCGATADEAIRLYAEKRTLDGCGVTIPSQLRYIHYYEQFLESRTLSYDPRLLTLQEIVINTIPKPLSGQESSSNYLILTIMSGDTKIYESLPQHSTVDTQLQRIKISITDKIVLAGDVKMMLWYDTMYKRSHLCHFCFNTTFIDSSQDSLHLEKSEVDKACKDKLHSIFDRDFSVNVRFAPALARQSPLPTLDNLPNRAILLKYKSPDGPNSVEVSLPSFSSVRASPERSRSGLPMFGMGSPKSTSSEPKEGSQEPRDSSSNMKGPALSNQEPNGKPPHSPMLVHCGKAAFKPTWSNKSRDHDDDWDAASVNSDCSELDTHSEWWYTRPPRPSTHSSTVMAAGTPSVNATPPETNNRKDLRIHVTDAHKESTYEPPSPSLLSPSFRPGLPASSSSAAPPSPPNSAKKTPPHSASSPLAREVRFESESGSISRDIFASLDTQEANGTYNGSPQRARNGLADRHPGKLKNDSLEGPYLNEEGELIADSGTDSGIGKTECDRERERGWVNSMSRWFWSDGAATGETEKRKR